MTTQMIKTVTERVNEMTKNVEIQKIMMSFSDNEEAQDWIIKAAIATLVIPQNER
jgi:hypothetical protein